MREVAGSAHSCRWVGDLLIIINQGVGQLGQANINPGVGLVKSINLVFINPHQLI